MYTTRRKKTYCQNCHYPLTDNYNFCPNCGQDNSDKMVSFGTLTGEFFGNLMAYDSRLMRTIRPFLFKPGFLTNQFIAGRRVEYVHPLKLYFNVSFFFFLVLSLSANQTTNDALADLEKEQAADSTQTDSTQKERVAIMSGGVPVNVYADSAATDSVSIFSKAFSKKFLESKQTTSRQIVDSIGWEQTIINRYVVGQVMKFARMEGRDIGTYFTDYFLSKISIIMFFLLPVFALLLKLVYWRRHRYYVEHLTFTLHIHAFAFLILLLQLLIDRVARTDWTNDIATLLILVYGAIAARRVYRQKWAKTLLKGFMLSVAYLICFGLFSAGAILIGGLMF